MATNDRAIVDLQRKANVQFPNLDSLVRKLDAYANGRRNGSDVTLVWKKDDRDGPDRIVLIADVTFTRPGSFPATVSLRFHDGSVRVNHLASDDTSYTPEAPASCRNVPEIEHTLRRRLDAYLAE